MARGARNSIYSVILYTAIGLFRQTTVVDPSQYLAKREEVTGCEGVKSSTKGHLPFIGSQKNSIKRKESLVWAFFIF
jgi:hypothetical protein